MLTDHISNVLLCPTQTAVDNLAAEGVVEGVYKVGDVMYDAVLQLADIAQQRSNILQRNHLEPSKYILATIHRPSNTDDPLKLRAILDAFDRLEINVIFPVHPRTQQALTFLESAGYLLEMDNVMFIPPVSYLDMLMLEKNAQVILTDSGGVQKEAYFFGVPCLTLRSETEWVETIESGWNHLVDVQTENLAQIILDLNRNNPRPPIFGKGDTAQKIVAILHKSSIQSKEQKS